LQDQVKLLGPRPNLKSSRPVINTTYSCWLR
jgi:hypothetical protein